MATEYPSREEVADAVADLHDQRNTVLESPAMGVVVNERIKQLDLGHTHAVDMQLPHDELPRKAKDYLAHAIDQITADPERRDLVRARKNIARAAALCLAAIDCLPTEKL